MEESVYIDINRPWLAPLEKGDNEHDCIFPDRGLRLIGLRLYPGGNNGEEQNVVSHIQKSLYRRSNWFYFYKGFNIVETKNEPTKIERIEVEKSVFDSSEFLYSEPSGVRISISAVVGENGTGKSTILDSIIRLINNLSAAIYGEGFNYASTGHLNYVDNVYASLAVYVNTRIEIITCLGRVLTVTRYELGSNTISGACAQNDWKGPVVEEYHQTHCEIILDGSIPKETLLPSQEEKTNVLRHLFFTLVSNYSLYAYNFLDYYYERTDKNRLAELNRRYPDEELYEEDAYWLKGVFHKNDGYQTPIVIHPKREDGYINARSVNYIGKNNLISLAFEQRKRTKEDGTQELYFPFREINKTHHLVAFYFDHPDYKVYQGFWHDCALERFDQKWANSNKSIIECLESPIREFWSEQLDLEYCQHKNNDLIQQAWDYLVYKTIKIISTYKHYEADWKVAKSKDLDVALFKERLKNIVKDSSHRTTKLRRTVSYLRFNEDPDYYMRRVPSDLDEAYDWMQTKKGQKLYPKEESDFHTIEVDDLLPPPFIDVVFQLVDNEHLQDYSPGSRNNEIIPFEGLSSGERQIAYSLANIIYHLKNIESGRQDKNTGQQHVSSTRYNYVNLLLDEVELYFHPDLQRRFVSLLVDSIRGLQLKGIFGICITLVTHSPFVLSDIPESNILFLSRDKGKEVRQKTYAANIHDLFNDAFFLPNTMGVIAQRSIERVVSDYNRVKENRFSEGEWPETINEDAISKDRYVASIVGDEYLCGELNDMLDEMKEWKIEMNRPGHEED